MIYIGIDDTDTLESRGTNQLARDLVERLAVDFRCLRITRHQLLHDPRIPFTSKNGSASIVLEPRVSCDLDPLFELLAEAMRAAFIPGSDPGLCVATEVPPPVQDFGQRCQQVIVTQPEARQIAASAGLRLLGLGGTDGGVIGALAAVGLAAGNNDGRVIYLNGSLDQCSGILPLSVLHSRDITVRDVNTNLPITAGCIDVGKKLRPNWRNGKCVLFARQATPFVSSNPRFEALKLT